MKKIIFSTLILFSSCFGLQAELYKLDLQKSIEVSKSKSYTMLELSKDLEIAEYNLKSATSKFKTHINLNFVTPEYSNTLQRYVDSAGVTYFPLKQLNYNGNVVINQPLPTDGSVYIRSGMENTNDFKDFARTSYLNTRFGITQPLGALYGYNNIKSGLKRAELAYEQSKKSLKRAELNLIYQVSSAFYNLLSVQKETELARLNLERQQDAREIAKRKYDAGLIREVDALQMEVDLAEAKNNYDLAQVGMQSAMNAFKELIGINFSDSVSISSEFNYEIVVVDPEKAVQLALENRLEIREQEIQLEQNKLDLKREKSNGMIQADLTAYYEKAGVSAQNMSTSLVSSVNSTYNNFKTRQGNYGVGLVVSVSVLDWGENRALVKAAEARLKQNQLQKVEVQRSIEREVRNLVADLNSSLQRLQLLEKNVSVAEKSFSITRQRFEDGDIDSQSLALERNRLNNAYTSHLRAYITYQLLIADLTRKTFFDFKKNELIK
ncbi:MAG TPA: TolC family protein [Paludibacter sp.]|nr:TolC family protein [Paludibacter sp.]